jgi:Zn-dependent protease with chaperone function
MLLLRNLCLVTFIFCALPVLSQSSEAFTPLLPDSALYRKLEAQLAARYQQDISHLSGVDKKEIAAIYKERYGLISEKLQQGEILCHEETGKYLAALASEIFKNNPNLNPGEVRLFFSRAFYANASSFGEGTILFNIGLFHRLQNEAQAAFVISHELAHYFLNHSNNNIAQYVATTTSDAFQKELKQIQRSGYRQNSQLEQLAKNLMFRSRRHSRAFEQAADSMALDLLKNTGYDVKEALTCLQLLDSADKDKFNTGLALEQQFRFEAFPFKPRWLQSDDLRFVTNTGKQGESEGDSLKTHPDCKKRIDVLTGRVQQYAKAGTRKFIVSEPLFQKLIAGFDLELIEYCLQTKQLSRALHFSLAMLPLFPDNAYLHATVGHCLNRIYTAQKTHELGKVTELPNPAFDEKYNKLLLLIQNLRLPEIAALSYYFLKQNENRFASDAGFVKALIQSKAQYNQPEEQKHWEQHYTKTFSKPHNNQ